MKNIFKQQKQSVTSRHRSAGDRGGLYANANACFPSWLFACQLLLSVDLKDANECVYAGARGRRGRAENERGRTGERRSLGMDLLLYGCMWLCSVCFNGFPRYYMQGIHFKNGLHTLSVLF